MFHEINTCHRNVAVTFDNVCATLLLSAKKEQLPPTTLIPYKSNFNVQHKDKTDARLISTTMNVRASSWKQTYIQSAIE